MRKKLTEEELEEIRRADLEIEEEGEAFLFDPINREIDRWLDDEVHRERLTNQEYRTYRNRQEERKRNQGNRKRYEDKRKNRKRDLKEYKAAHYRAFRERYREQHAAYYEKNKESFRERAKKYREDHKEELKKKKAEYYQKNRERILAQAKERYWAEKKKAGKDCTGKKGTKTQEEIEQHREELKRRKAEYYQKNRERILARAKERYWAGKTAGAFDGTAADSGGGKTG